jgi:uncharacterized protein YgbK (DUF1537 family)
MPASLIGKEGGLLYRSQIDAMPSLDKSALDRLPLAFDRGHFGGVLRLLAKSSVKAVVLDDDPTGTQTVHGVDVLADWSTPSLAAALAEPGPCFFVLTNTRSMPGSKAARVNREIVANLTEASRIAERQFVVVSRSDSTLRGHFETELAALRDGLPQPVDGTIVIPAFFEGGRYTVGNVHYVAEGDRLVPAAETEFARDATFGYFHSDLTEWIEEKTGGAVKAAHVAAIDIATLRGEGGAESVQSTLLALPKGAYLVVNAASYGDIEAFVHGLLLAEASGKRYLFRTAASFVRVRAGLQQHPLLSASDYCEAGGKGGLVVVGSYTQRTTAQLESLLELSTTTPVEVSVDRLASDDGRSREIQRVSAEARKAIDAGSHAVVYTSRSLESALGRAGDLAAGEIVSESLVGVVQSLGTRPRFVIAKGGITSSDIATRGFGMRRARVLGQASPGVPVWHFGAETRFPGMKYVVWPGNVGARDTLRDVVRLA